MMEDADFVACKCLLDTRCDVGRKKIAFHLYTSCKSFPNTTDAFANPTIVRLYNKLFGTFNTLR